MKIPALLRSVLLLLFLANGAALIATCGGGGGGGAGGAGMGGMGGMGPSQPVVYNVPWHILEPTTKLASLPDTCLVVLWFPSNILAVKNSDMRTSRLLTQSAARGVADFLVPYDELAFHGDYKIGRTQDAAVLIDLTGQEVGRVVADAKTHLDTRAVEKMLTREIDAREKSLKTMADAAEKRLKSGDKTAADDLQKVWAQRALFPSLGKRAAKALEKAGVKVSLDALERLGPDDLADPDIHGEHPEIEATLKAGLEAELASDYLTAGRMYEKAVALDPSDATALRFLGEYYRHVTGEWNKAGRIFRTIVAQPADPLARAVALHGLGKMTIHAGRFKAGLQLFEDSLAAYPLPITYRNLAVYWFSERQHEKAAGFMRQAIALAPDDPYNQVFAAVYLAAAGHKDEALAIAKANENLMEASYNLAAIWSQAGDQKKAMEMLRRHFLTYERYEPVRAMEMKEAREDYMFAALYTAKEFDDLTKGAKNAWMVGLEWCDPTKLKPVEGPPGPRTMTEKSVATGAGGQN